MQWLILSIAFFSYLDVVFSTDVINKIENFNKLLYELNIHPDFESVNSCFVEYTINPDSNKESESNKKSNNPFTKCLEDICGSADKLDNYEEVYEKVKERSVNMLPQHRQLTNELGDKVRNYYEREINFKIDTYKKLKAFLEQGNTTIPQYLQELQAFIFLSTQLGQLKHEDFDIDNIKVDFSNLIYELPLKNKEAKERFRKYANKSLINNLFETSNELMLSHATQTAILGNSFGWGLIYRSKYPDMSLREIIKKESEKLEKTYTDLKNKLRPVQENIGVVIEEEIIDDEIFKKIQDTEYPSEAMISELFYKMSSINFLNNKNKNTHFPNLIKEDYSQLYDIDKIKNQIDIIIRELVDLKENKKGIEKRVQRCNAVLINNLIAMPSEEEKNNIIKKSKLLLKKIKEEIVGRFSKRTSGLLNIFLDGIHLVFPETKKDISFIMNNRIEGEIAAQENFIDFLKKKSAEQSEKDAILFTINEIPSWSSDEPLSKVFDICNEYKLNKLNDASYNLGIGSIRVSWISVKKPQMGGSIMAHEYAHAVGNYFDNNAVSKQSFGKYKNLRMCLNDMQYTLKSNKEEERSYFEEDGPVSFEKYKISQYTEEDWADFISSKVIKKDGPNFGCFLEKQNSNFYTSSEIFKMEDSDSHSPALYRTLHIEFVKSGKLPDSCNEIAKKNNIQLKFKSCEF